MASYVVTQLAGFQVHTEPVVNLDTDHYHILHQRLIEHEELLYGTAMQVQVYRSCSHKILHFFPFLHVVVPNDCI